MRRAYGQNQYAYNGSLSSIKKGNPAVPTPGLSPILSSNESDSRGEISFSNNNADDSSLGIDKKISRSLIFGDVADLRQHEGNAKHGHIMKAEILAKRQAYLTRLEKYYCLEV